FRSTANMRFKLFVVACVCLCIGLNGCTRGGRTTQTNIAPTPADGTDNTGLPQPQDAAGYVALGNALYQKDQDEKAVAAYQQALKLKPNYAQAYTKLARYKEAMDAFQHALDLDPDLFRASEALERAKEGNQRVEEGRKAYEQQLKRQQANANNQNTNQANTSNTAGNSNH